MERTSRTSRIRRRLRATSPVDQAIRIALGLMLLSGAVAGTSASSDEETGGSRTHVSEMPDVTFRSGADEPMTQTTGQAERGADAR